MIRQALTRHKQLSLSHNVFRRQYSLQASSSSPAPAVRPRRALLYMPGNNLKFIKKAAASNVDTICMDLEDALTYDKKEGARATIVEALETLDFGHSEVMYRINPIDTNLYEDDLRLVLERTKKLPDGVVVPKVESASQIELVDSLIRRFAGDAGAKIKLLVLVETALAMTRLGEIAHAVPDRLEGIIFGADDYAASVGAVRSPDNDEVSFARNMVLMHAKAASIQAIDMVNISFKDPEPLVAESIDGFKRGFTGKQIIHPNQIDPVQKHFSPSNEVVARAKKVMDAYEHHLKLSKGAFVLDGQMIDMPTIKNAQSVLARAEACGLV